MRRPALLVLFILLFCTSCAQEMRRARSVPAPDKKLIVLPEKKYDKFSPYVVNGERYYPIPDAQGYVKMGKASWYGQEFHGRPTANGEVFDMLKKSAAHKTLPLGTYVQVVNLSNGKETVVRINDRGPFVKGRIIDLSYAAARDIDLIGPGTADVKVVALAREVGTLKSSGGMKPVVEIANMDQGEYTVQVGAFFKKENALRVADRLKVIFDYVDVAVSETEQENKLYRVRVTKSKSLIRAAEMEKRLEEMGFGEAFIVSL
jgi:rare lipoprotein A